MEMVCVNGLKSNKKFIEVSTEEKQGVTIYKDYVMDNSKNVAVQLT